MKYKILVLVVILALTISGCANTTINAPENISNATELSGNEYDDSGKEGSSSSIIIPLKKPPFID